LSSARSVFTPGDKDPGTEISSDLAQAVGLPVDGNVPATFSDTGAQHADASILPPGVSPLDGAAQFDTDEAQHGQQLADLYDQMLSEVPA
jgi:hypothetical protein